jgi:hypothetical protein
LVRFAELGVVDGAFDRAALGVAEHHDRLGAGEPGREFEAADDVGVDEIAGDPRDENVADALIEHQLRRHAAVDAADHRGERRLAVGGGSDLLHEVAVDALAGGEALVAGLEQADRVAGRDRRLPGRGVDRAILRGGGFSNGGKRQCGCAAAQEPAGHHGDHPFSTM